jgi:hypothetical protein
MTITKDENTSTAISYDIGDILEVETFAGPKVYKKVLSIVDRSYDWSDGETTNVKGFNGAFVRRKDLYSLKRFCVPYTGKEVLRSTKSFTFDWQILRLVKKGRKKEGKLGT